MFAFKLKPGFSSFADHLFFSWMQSKECVHSASNPVYELLWEESWITHQEASLLPWSHTMLLLSWCLSFLNYKRKDWQRFCKIPSSSWGLSSGQVRKNLMIQIITPALQQHPLGYWWWEYSLWFFWSQPENHSLGNLSFNLRTKGSE